MNKIISLLTGMLFLGTATVANAAGIYGAYGAYGQTNCQPIYGGGQTCVVTDKVVLNKTVRNPQTGKYVDNLSLSDPRYLGGQSVSFQLTVTNTGNTKLASVDVSDTLPNYIEKVSGPGSYDSNSKTLSFRVQNLDVNESRTFTVAGTIVDSTKLPMNQGVTCLVNQAVARADKQESRDNSQFCVEKQSQATTKGGLPVMQAPAMAQTPSTGPEMLSLVGLIPAGLGGLFLRRKASK